MTYRVHFTESAAADAQAVYDWIAQRAPRAAVKWFNGLLDVVASLGTFPTRCGIAPESTKAGEQIRHMLYGRKPHVYRILFTIRVRDVYVLHIRLGALLARMEAGPGSGLSWHGRRGLVGFPERG